MFVSWVLELDQRLGAVVIDTPTKRANTQHASRMAGDHVTTATCVYSSTTCLAKEHVLSQGFDHNIDPCPVSNTKGGRQKRSAPATALFVT
jgi:hypothetical protein